MIWKIYARQPSKWKDSKDYARECYQAKVIAVGWNQIGDLNEIPSRQKLVEKLTRKWGHEAENGAHTISQWAGSLWAFRTKVEPGHYVICPDGNSQRYYVGIVKSKKVYHDPSPLGGCIFAHRRDVDWVRRPLNHEEMKMIWPDGRFGGLQTVSQIHDGADRLQKLLKRRRRPLTPHAHLPVQPDNEWGKQAEERAMIWLRKQGLHPVNEAHLNKGWDISCGDEKFEVKGRKSFQTAVRLSQNEWRAAKKYQKQYTLLIFTAPTLNALKNAVPQEFVDPANTESWKKRIVYEYVLFE